MQNLRLIMTDVVKNSSDSEDVAVLLSGGIDSTCVLISCLEAGFNVSAYTFYLEGQESQDVRASREICKELGVSLCEVVVPYSTTILEEDVRKIIDTFRTTRKTAIQCVHPFLYVALKVVETDVFSGLYADDLWGTSRAGSYAWKMGKEHFDEFRKSQLEQSDYSCVYIKKLFSSLGKRLHTPFTSNEVSGYLMSLGWDEMNRPKPKIVAVRSYGEYYRSHNWYRRNSNLQVNSGIREYHDMLLNTHLNKRGLKSVTGIYNDILSGRV